jgi:spermidine synthase
MSAIGSPDNNSNLASSPRTDTGPSVWTLFAVGACFALSGFAALLYQTAWLRQFSLVFGTSEVAVATVLAAYMGGLALGAHVVERYLDRVRRPVLVYGVLEFGIALGALAVPLLLIGAEALMVATLGKQAAPPSSTSWVQTAFYLVTAFVVLIVPTALMGATLPLLTRHAVRTEAQIAARTGLLYAINTLGAVGGALVAAFILLQELGLRGTVYVGAAVNALVFAIAAGLAVRWPAPRTAAQPVAAARSQASWHSRIAFGPHWILPVMLISGVASFVYEVLWTRMLSFVLGSSIYAFATMVASFLLGIALGSAIASQVARSRRIAQIAFVITQLAIAACSIAIYLSIDRLVPEHAGLRGNIALAIAVMLPATIFIGATFPLAVRIYTDEPRAAAGATARVYAWNTVGAILGALLAGFVLIPALRFEGTIHFAVLLNAALALVACVAIARASWKWSAGVALLGIAAAVLFRAPIPDRLIHTSPLNVAAFGNVHYYEVGRSATVVMLEQDGELMLRTNGLPEAMIDMVGSAPKFSGEFWLSPLAVIARPSVESMLIVGYGGGVVVDGVPPTVRSIDVIELEPKVMDANRRLRQMRERDPLADPRVNVIINDARGALMLTDKRYDAIVSQPSHPWTAGASHLYTREFMRQSNAHLNDGGVFIQWMNVAFLDEDLLRSLTATLLDVFGHLRIYRPDPNTLVFLASNRPLDIETQLTRSGIPLWYSPKHYARFAIHAPEDVVAALVADQEGVEALARGAELITDDRNRMATAGAYDRGTGLTAESTSRVLAQYDPLQRRGSWVFRNPDLKLSFSYIARRMALFTQLDPRTADRLLRMGRAIEDPSTAAYVRAIAHMTGGDRPGSRRLLEEALALDPGNRAARFELVRPWLGPLSQNKATPEIVEIARGLTGSGAAVLEAGKAAAAGDWAKLPQIDPALRSTQWTDAWYFESVQMRADWRVRVSNPEVRKRYGREALAILDESVVSQPTPTMYALRARAAMSADRPDVLLESIYSFSYGISTTLLRTPERELPQVRASLDALINMVNGMASEERIRQSRRAEVLAHLAKTRDAVLERAAAS